MVRPLRSPTMDRAAFIPDIPDTIPSTKVYKEGEDGKSLDWRMREHWIPSSVWRNLKSTVPPVSLCLLKRMGDWRAKRVWVFWDDSS